MFGNRSCKHCSPRAQEGGYTIYHTHREGRSPPHCASVVKTSRARACSRSSRLPTRCTHAATRHSGRCRTHSLAAHVFQARSRSRTSCRPTLSHLHAPSLRCWCGSLAAKFTSLTRYLALVSASQSSALAMKTKPSIPPTDWCTGWARRAPRRRLLGSGRGIQRSGGSSTIQRSA